MTRIDAEWLKVPEAQAVCAMLQRAGHQAWFVGGCVRNALIGAPVSDLDISTDARPDRVLALAEDAGLKAIPTGIDHGTVTVVAGTRPFEITTFRRDVDTDGRRAVVAFANTLEEDARRRDFTMNALYAGIDGDVTDPLNGLPDLQARRVRFIDDPHERIREDYLRILRFFRFHAWYGDPADGLDADGLAACAELAGGMDRLSKERIGHEMLKLLAAPDPAPSVASMGMTGVLMRVLPGASAEPLTRLVHAEEQLSLPPDPIARLAALGGESVPKALRLSKADARQWEVLTEAAASGMSAAELGYRHGPQNGMAALALRSALMASPPNSSDGEEVAYGAAQSFPVTATDLMPKFSGPALGRKLRDLEALWIASGFELSREALLKVAE